MNFFATGTAPRRMGNTHPNICPYQVIPCADGHIILAVGNDAQFARLAALLGHPGWAAEARFATNAARVANRETLMALIEEQTTRRSRAELLAACEAASVPAGPINTVAEVFTDPQVTARALRIAPEGVPGLRTPIRFSETALALDRASPPLGESDDAPHWRAPRPPPRDAGEGA